MTALRALNRFGLGAGPGEAQALDDPRGWLESQLDEPAPTRPAPEGAVDVGALVREQREVARSDDEDRRADLRRRIFGFTVAESRDALTARTTSERPFVERLVAFWSNHLCVSAAAKLPTRLLAGSYERDAIRPHVLGRFDEMVLASVRHPAMLTYLDNAQSVGPDSPAARTAARRRRGDDGPPVGLNENHARELLELHTVGVDGGYDQDDVRALARVLTGWTVTGLGGAGARFAPGDDVGFRFAPLLHDPGEKTVLGRRYGEGGEGEGEAVIRDLCHHPSTATFLATKLVRHFVDDEPPPGAVEAVARRFRDTDGDLRETARILVHLDDAWSGERRKFRTPQDWLVAMLRGLGAREAPPAVLGVLGDLRHPLWAPPSPKGFGDTVAEWADPDGLLNRAELARTVARTPAGRRVGSSRGLPALADLSEGGGDAALHALLADSTIPSDERVALAFAGPAFQWR